NTKTTKDIDDRVDRHAALLAAARAIAGAIESDDEPVAHQPNRNRLVLDREVADPDHLLGAETRRQKAECTGQSDQRDRFADGDHPEPSLLATHGQNTLRIRPMIPPRVLPMSPVSEYVSDASATRSEPT